jgi:hypothetical protein
MPLDVGAGLNPGGGFWSNMVPTALNAVGSQMGGPMGQASQVAGQLAGAMNKRKNKGQQGTDPSATTPNNPFQKVNLGGPQNNPNIPGQQPSPPMFGPTGGMQPGPTMGGGFMPPTGGMNPLWQNYMNQPQVPMMR